MRLRTEPTAPRFQTICAVSRAIAILGQTDSALHELSHGGAVRRRRGRIDLHRAARRTVARLMNMRNKIQEDLTDVLNEIDDPELGIGIVDMGLIYRAEWNAKGIDVEFTTTSPSCPFEELLFQDINNILSHRFREAASIHVRLVLDPPWTPERLSENARRTLGWVQTAGNSSVRSPAAPGKTKLSRRHTTGNLVRQRNFIN